MIIGVMCIVCLVSGVYIKFFNHESSDQLLIANRQGVQGAAVVIAAAKPNFHRLGTNIIKKEDSNKDTDEGVQRVEAQQLEHIIDEGETHQVDDNEEAELDEASYEDNEEKEDERGDDHQEEKPNDVQKDETNHDQVDPQPFDADKPIERVEGEDEDEEEDELLHDAGGDGGERKEEEEEEDIEEGYEKQDGRGPHGIKLFDWDHWIKDNQFVDLGNVWGYCDDDDPPVIGKIILLEDEERGGVKSIFLFNTTFDKDVLMGKVEISIDYNGMHFWTKTADLEDLEIEGDFFKAPIVKGDHYFVREKHISSFIPKGHYYGEAKMTDQNDRSLLCSTMNLHMK